MIVLFSKDIIDKALTFGDNPTPVSAVFADKIDTPKKGNETESDMKEIKISPLLANNPWITMTRGSSSKKERQTLDAATAAAAAPEVQSSPILRRRSYEDFSAASPIVAVTKLGNSPASVVRDPRDAQHFRNIVVETEARLKNTCYPWETHLAACVPDEETGTVRTVIGQAHLLQRERFTQFCGLIDQFEQKSGEKEITPTDLEGFWEMIYLQVRNCSRVCCHY